MEAKTGKTDEKRTGGKFLCSNCEFTSPFDYLGTTPPFAKSMVVLEECYIMKDPFTHKHEAVLLGSHCSLCRMAVCMAPDCSLFYSKRFCLACVRENIAEFPGQIQQEMAKRKVKEDG